MASLWHSNCPLTFAKNTYVSVRNCKREALVLNYRNYLDLSTTLPLSEALSGRFLPVVKSEVFEV